MPSKPRLQACFVVLASTVPLLVFSAIRSDAGDAWGAFTVSCVDGICGDSCDHAIRVGPTQDAVEAGSYEQAVSDVNSRPEPTIGAALISRRAATILIKACAISASEADALKKLDAMGLRWAI